MDSSEFGDALARVKSIPGRRFNPDLKRWELRNDPDTALRAMQMLDPYADPAVQEMVRDHAATQAADLVTTIGDDATLGWHRAPDLWPFQRAGVDWLVDHPKSILADEMGLGKTIEAIGVVEESRRRAAAGDRALDGPVCVVAPNSCVGTWVDELNEWAGVEPVVIDGRNPAIRRKQLAADAPVFVVNWEKLQTRVKLIDDLAKRSESVTEPWAAVIADEAHRAKNHKAQQAKGLWKLRAPIQLALTGTPLMNSPDELFSLLKWLRPEQYTSFWTFHYSYVDEYIAGKHARVMIGVKNVDDLRFELSDKLARRTKLQVLPDLPEKLPAQTIELPMKAAQRRLYDEAEDAFFLDVAEALKDPEDEAQRRSIEAAVEYGDIRALSTMISNGGVRVTRLRQIASSPALLGGPDESATFDAIVETVRDNPGKPFVIFAWYRQAVQCLVDRLERGKPALRVGRIMGDDDAHAVTESFQNGNLDIIVSTIAKGGTGLTWTRADTALFAEEDWVPDINKQAEDRLHRIGQKNAVTIKRFRSAQSVHTGRIANAHRAKERIRDAVLGLPAGLA